MFGPLEDNIYQVKSQTKSATHLGGGNWVGDLENIKDGEAYLVNMHNADDWYVTGSPIPYDTPIELDKGWNWIAYYPEDPVEVGIALASISSTAKQVKNQTQSATNYQGVWIGDLTVMEPGIGYKLDMSDEDVLIYQLERSGPLGGNTGSGGVAGYNPLGWELMPGTQYNMVLMLKVNCEIGFESAGVFDEDGICRSIGITQEYNGNEFWYFTIVGNEEPWSQTQRELYVKLYDSETNLVYSTHYQSGFLIFVDNTTIGNPEQPFLCTAFGPILWGSSNNADTPTNYSLVQNHPNPFNPETNISYQIPEVADVEITIYNIRGEKVKTLVNERKSAGHYSIIWNGTDDNDEPVSSGIYLYKLSTPTYSEIKKCFLMK